MRAGTDILFLGGLIHYALENDKYFREYVQHYTNAPMIIRDEYRDTEDLGGVFSGWDEQKKKYNPGVLALQRFRRKNDTVRSRGKAGHSRGRRRPRQRPRRRSGTDDRL